MIDLYCERISAGLWAEPVNAATNLAFLVAAWATRQLIRRSGPYPAAALWNLPVLMVCVGLGSGLFHTVATAWARVLDVLPILLFQLTFLWLYARRILALGGRGAVTMIAAFLVTAGFARQFPAVLSGSLAYAPAALVILALGVAHHVACRRERLGLLSAGALFLLAVGLRSVDQVLCDRWPLGTHFLWHLLAALAMYLVSRALVLNWPPGWRHPSVNVTAPDPRGPRTPAESTADRPGRPRPVGQPEPVPPGRRERGRAGRVLAAVTARSCPVSGQAPLELTIIPAVPLLDLGRIEDTLRSRCGPEG